MENNIKHKSRVELEKLTAARLLAYYKTIRKQTILFRKSFFCECCGGGRWITHGNQYSDEQNKKMEEDAYTAIKIAEDYLNEVKMILETREHVERKTKKS